MTSVEVLVDEGGRTRLVGQAHVTRARGQVSTTFLYDPGYLTDDGSPIDPALPLVSGAQHQDGLVRAFADSAPDRWGRNLVEKAERRRATEEGRAPRRLDDLDFLLGVSDDTRQGALRFRIAGHDEFLGKPARVPVEWQALPASSPQDLLAGFAAWRSGCAKLSRDPVWAEPCKAAQAVPAKDADAVQRFLGEQLRPYRLQTGAGHAEGLITGYYEPVYDGSRTSDAAHRVAVYGVPDDLIAASLDSLYPALKGQQVRGRLEGRRLLPYADAAQIRRKGVPAPVLAWLRDPMDLQFLQIQGSGRVRLDDGSRIRLGYAEQNGHPYRAIGGWLVQQGELTREQVSMPAIRDWARAHPERVAEMLDSNPRYIFFSASGDSDEGPRGSLNVPLSAGYSVAIDRQVIPLGSLLWLSTTRPDDGRAIQRPVAAQDTGGAIRGEVRADLFWGTGDAAGELAGHMKQPGRLWLLWPRQAPAPQAQ